MAQLSEIEQLAERRRLLAAESDRLRQQIGRHLEALRPAVTWAQKGYSLAAGLRSSWPLIGLVAGVLATRKRGFFLRKFAKAWSWWQIGKRFAPLWRRALASLFPREEGD